MEWRLSRFNHLGTTGGRIITAIITVQHSYEEDQLLARVLKLRQTSAFVHIHTKRLIQVIGLSFDSGQHKGVILITYNKLAVSLKEPVVVQDLKLNDVAYP